MAENKGAHATGIFSATHTFSNKASREESLAGKSFYQGSRSILPGERGAEWKCFQDWAADRVGSFHGNYNRAWKFFELSQEA